jgi:hypothetical protein
MILDEETDEVFALVFSAKKKGGLDFSLLHLSS